MPWYNCDHALDDKEFEGNLISLLSRRNPVIADLLNRIKFMERRSSGLTKILSETAKLPGYTERMLPKFFSTPTDFRIVLKNVNYSSSERTAQDDRFKILVEFCSVPRTRNEIQALIGIEHREHFQKTFPK